MTSELHPDFDPADDSGIHPDFRMANRYGIPADVHLISCGKQKLTHPAPARDLYTSTTFRAARDFASGRAGLSGTGPAPCYVVSALHGILPLDRTVAPYDVAMANLDADERAEWIGMVQKQLAALGIERANFHVHGSALYCDMMREAVRPFGRVVNFFNYWGDSARTGTIGNRRGFYRRSREVEARWRAGEATDREAVLTP